MEITEEQREKIAKILYDTCCHFANDNSEGVYVDDWITWDEMVAIVGIIKEKDEQHKSRQ